MNDCRPRSATPSHDLAQRFSNFFAASRSRLEKLAARWLFLVNVLHADEGWSPPPSTGGSGAVPFPQELRLGSRCPVRSSDGSGERRVMVKTNGLIRVRDHDQSFSRVKYLSCHRKSTSRLEGSGMQKPASDPLVYSRRPQNSLEGTTCALSTQIMVATANSSVLQSLCSRGPRKFSPLGKLGPQ